MCVYCVNARGRGPEDLGGLGEEKPGEIQSEDDEFDLYRKRMMLAYRFRPNPLVRYFFCLNFKFLTCQLNLIMDFYQFLLAILYNAFM